MKLSKSKRHLKDFSPTKCHLCNGEGYDFLHGQDEEDDIVVPCRRCFGKGKVSTFQDKYFNIVTKRYKKYGWKIPTSRQR